ncbi:MAG TPA: 2-hydroxyacid dehydrogenase [Thermomicrobiales bacterium]|nr:2-hydroxyacid dehydrogenase [Thermomicrobiales bacterium]
MKVVFTDPVPADWIQRIQAALPEGASLQAVASYSDEDFGRLAADADVLLTMTGRIDAARLAMAPRLRLVQQLGTGYDNIDVEAVRAAGVPAAHNPGANAVAVAEHTIMLMLVLLRQFPACERVTRAGAFARPEGFRTTIELSTATVGLVGLGAIGEAVAERLAPFGPRLLYTTRHRRDAATESRLRLEYSELPALLAASNVVSIHARLTDATYHLLGDAELARMPAGSYLINTARGGIVDEEALRRAIERGQISGAAFDVLEHEREHVNTFADLPQVVVTGHMAGAGNASFERMIERSVANVVRAMQGEPVQNLLPELQPGDHLEP